MMIGYARVSTQGQDLDQQRAALGAVGCVRLFEEKVSGAKRDRSELVKLLDHLRPGDVVTVTRLDRLARSTRDLLDIAEQIKEAEAGGSRPRRAGCGSVPPLPYRPIRSRMRASSSPRTSPWLRSRGS